MKSGQVNLAALHIYMPSIKLRDEFVTSGAHPRHKAIKLFTENQILKPFDTKPCTL